MQQANEVQENFWSGLLDSVSSGRRLPEKQLLLVGGDSELQQEFLVTLDSDTPKKPRETRRKRPPVSNEFALGYTYQEVLDADHEDILARLSVYTLQQPAPAFLPLVKTLLTPQTVQATLVVILLDWAEPWNWIRQIRDWTLFVQTATKSVDVANLDANKQDLRVIPSSGGVSVTGEAGNHDDYANDVPSGPGENDEGFGLPICVVCHNSNRIETLEKDYSWREEEFDYLLQFLRTVLLKYGASLIYTSNAAPNSVPLLIQSSLNIHSTLGRQTLKHNVVDRESILIPPNWDSWGKIRVIREGFDVESISEAWSEAIRASTAPPAARNDSAVLGDAENDTPVSEAALCKESDWANVLHLFNEAIKDPAPPLINSKSAGSNSSQTKSLNMQDFLGKQAEIMEKLRQEEEKTKTAGDTRLPDGRSNGDEGGTMNRVNEHIGPVKFNMGGIQVDAEDMLKTLRNPERDETPGLDTDVGGGLPSGTATPDGGKQQNEALASFFAGLIKKGGTPKPGGK